MRTPPERIHWWNPPQLPGVQILECDHCPKLWKVYHETYTVCTMTGITSRWSYRGRTVTTEPGGLMLMEPGEVHTTHQVRGDLHYRVALFPPRLFEEASWELTHVHDPPQLATPHLAAPRVYRAFSAFHSCLERRASALEAESRMSACIRLFLEHATEKPIESGLERGGREGLSRIRDYLHATACEPVSLDDLAKVSGLSRYHLVRRFALEFGLPPHAYQVQLRVFHAKRLLLEGVPAAHVAARAGFYDQSHMNRHFRRTLGVSCGAFAGNPARTS